MVGSRHLLKSASLGLALLLFAIGAVLAQPPERVSQEVRDRIAQNGRAAVIVQLDLPDDAIQRGRPTAEQIAARRARISDLQQQLRQSLRGIGAVVRREFANVPFVALDIDAQTLAALEAADSPAVRVIADRMLSPNLAESVPRIEGDLAHASGINGAGTVVAVLDSGVDAGHPFLAGRIVEEACFSSNGKGNRGDCPNGRATQTGTGSAMPCSFAPDSCAHGTHVAGIAAGAGSEFSGVAPGAALLPIQVFHASTTECLFPFEAIPCARAATSDVAAALDYVYEAAGRHNIAAVNLSLGGETFASACDADSPLFAAAIDNLKTLGIATVAASGNDGVTDGIAEPACVAAAVSVGATDDFDEVAWFSNSSADLDLLAPGTSITSSVPGGGFETREGTSMATPHVTGVWALYRQAFPNAGVDEALTQLTTTGLSIVDWRTGETKPRVRIGPALGIEAPAPVLDSVSPGTVNAYGPGFTLTVNGSGFVRSSQVQIDGVAQATTYVSDTQLSAAVASAALATSSPSLAVTVFTPSPGGGTSAERSIALLAPSVEVDVTSVTPGGTVTATVVNPPGWPGDWLALVRVGNSTSQYVAWSAVNAASPVWTVNMPTAEGDYEIRLMVNNSYTLQAAVSATINVGAGTPNPDPDPNPQTAALTLSTATAAPGEAVTATLSGAPGGSGDWIALVRVGAPTTSYVAYTYVGTGVTDRTWTVNMPQAEGDYEFRLLLNNSYTNVAAVSPTVTVAAGSPDPNPDPDPQTATLSVSTTTAAPQESVTVTLSGAPGGATDWLALVPVGAPTTSYVAYTYVGAGITDRTWTVNMPRKKRDYEFRLMLNNSYTNIAAVSPAVTVE